MSASVAIALAAYRPPIPAFREQLETIRAQTHADWRCFVTLDSPLGELRVPELESFLGDPRFDWHENPRRLGFKDNFAHAIGRGVESGARWIACADQDDVWYPHKIATLVGAIVGRPPLSVVHADMDVLLDGRMLSESAWELERRTVEGLRPTSLLVRNVVTGASMLMDAELPRRFPRVPDEALFHDHWYALLGAYHGGVYPVAERLHAYRQHGGNVVGLRPYRGFFDGKGVRQLALSGDEARANYRARVALARSAREAGLPLTRFQRLAFQRRLDAGTALFALGVVSMRDRYLARECIALGFGKLLETVAPRRRR